MLQLLLSEVAAHHRVAVLVDPIREVLTGHAGHAAFPVLQVSLVDVVPLLHDSHLLVQPYYSRQRRFGNGGSLKKTGGFGRPRKR